MDLKAIEAALNHCVPIEGIPHENWCYALIEQYGPDLLRLVRAMAWMEAEQPDVWPFGEGDQTWAATMPDGTFTGPTPLDAIEAAMAAMADQQTKGVDESP